ncbi:PKS-ER domain-containing protein [Fusarium keratoplasticum]|nr:PKS-ER domain-containing protein [Fusarium keratoplasticum]
MDTSNIPTTMQAWTFSTSGAPEQILSLNSSLPMPPKPKGSQVLVRISHAALSSAGKSLMMVVPSALRKNAIPELDFSGCVVLAGPGVPPRLGPGTPVFGTVSKYATAVSGHGTLAEYLLIGSDCLAIKPTNMTFAETACLSVLSQVAMGMIQKAQVKKGDSILINGGSGAVGTAAIQLAKHLGAHVVAVCSGSKADIVKSVGTDEVVDYRQVKSVPGFLTETYGRAPFDAILDTVGSQELFIKSPGYLKPDGIVVNVGEGNGETGQLSFILQALRNTHQPSFLGGVPRKYITFSAPLTGANAERLASLAEDGKMRVFIDSSFHFKDALKASPLSISALCEPTNTATRLMSGSTAQRQEEEF